MFIFSSSDLRVCVCVVVSLGLLFVPTTKGWNVFRVSLSVFWIKSNNDPDNIERSISDETFSPWTFTLRINRPYRLQVAGRTMRSRWRWRSILGLRCRGTSRRRKETGKREGMCSVFIWEIMSSSTASFSSCSVKLIRNCIPSLHLFPTTSRQPATESSPKPLNVIEEKCIEIFGLTAQTEGEAKWVTSR